MGIFDKLKKRGQTPEGQGAGSGAPPAFLSGDFAGAQMGGDPASYPQVTGKLIGAGAFGPRPEAVAFQEAAAMPVIGKEQIKEAMRTLRKYKAGKANFERRIVENEDWWKQRHWDHIPEEGTTKLKTKSAWLINVILSKHADAMDAVPEANFLPREAGDEAEATVLSKVVPTILESTDFVGVWSENWWKKLKAGVCIYGVFWDHEALNGLGDVAIRSIDPLHLYWEPGIKKLQDSRNVFSVAWKDKDLLTQQYPELEEDNLSNAFSEAKYRYDDSVDTSGKCPVIDWYYKKREGGRTVLHYVKFVGETVLFASENEAAWTERGIYDHGRYPFFMDVLFPEEGTPAGFGYVDICKDAQRQIDLMNNAVVANCVAAATPRWLKRGDDGVNEEEYADWTRPFVHVQGSIEENAMRQITVAPLSGNYLAILESKINEIKETSGNRDVNNGGAPSGVTAASAIAAMQEQSGKLSRDQISESYKVFKGMADMVVELIRQFYDAPRQVRILGAEGENVYMAFDNRALQDRNVPGPDGKPGFRRVIFDIEVSAQKQSPYSKMANNELALQLNAAGVFNPAMGDQAMALLSIMDFSGKEKVMQIVQNNASLFKQVQQLTALVQQLMARMGMQVPEMGSRPGGTPGASFPTPTGPTALPETGTDGQPVRRIGIVDRARDRAQAATQPR